MCLLHDNTAVGNQLFGHWNSHADFRLAGLGRHLLVYAEHRFGGTWTTHYIAAHKGDIGNEIADSLAGAAAEGRALSDLNQWHAHVVDPNFCKAAAWFWTFYSRHLADWWDGMDICLPLQAATSPTEALLPQRCDDSMPTVCAEMDCTFGTCNVLTLRTAHKPTESETGLCGPTRQQIVFQQFHDARVCIFALQETRIKRSCANLAGYMIFRGDATQQGHHGTLIAISTTIPYGTYTDARKRKHELFFEPQDVSVIVTNARFVMLRLHSQWLHCILIAGHAPHSGYALEEIEHWWTNLGSHIPNSLQDWPVVLLADANAKIGADTCTCIGPHNAETGGEKALPFASFVRSNGLWLPSTFECHHGPSGTWQHHTGAWTRNDYVGLPTAWTPTGCSSWISEDIDVSLHHEDHRAALVRLRMDLTKTSSRRCRKPNTLLKQLIYINFDSAHRQRHLWTSTHMPGGCKIRLLSVCQHKLRRARSSCE